jgi:type I restriction enzyme, S subunit
VSDLRETESEKPALNWAIVSVGNLIEQNILEKPLDGNHGEIHPKGTDFVSSGIPL